MQADAASRMTLLAQHIESNISNSEVEALFEAMASMSPEARVTSLNAMLAEEGISSCPMAEIWTPIEGDDGSID